MATLIEVEKAAEFKEEEHPRIPAGQEGAGQFTEAGGTGAPSEPKADEPKRKVTQQDLADLREYVQELTDKGEDTGAAEMALAEAEASVEKGPPPTPEELGAAKMWVDRATARVAEVELKDQSFKYLEAKSLGDLTVAQHELDAAETEEPKDEDRIKAARDKVTEAENARDEAHDNRSAFQKSEQFRGAYADLSRAEERLDSLNARVPVPEKGPSADQVKAVEESAKASFERLRAARTDAALAREAVNEAKATIVGRVNTRPDVVAAREALDAARVAYNAEQTSSNDAHLAATQIDYDAAVKAADVEEERRLSAEMGFGSELATNVLLERQGRALEAETAATDSFREQVNGLAMIGEGHTAQNLADADRTHAFEVADRAGKALSDAQRAYNEHDPSVTTAMLSAYRETDEDLRALYRGSDTFKDDVEKVGAIPPAQAAALADKVVALGEKAQTEKAYQDAQQAKAEAIDKSPVLQEAAAKMEAAQAERDRIANEIGTTYSNDPRWVEAQAKAADAGYAYADARNKEEERIEQALDIRGKRLAADAARDKADAADAALQSAKTTAGTRSDVEGALGIAATDWSPRPRMSEAELGQKLEDARGLLVAREAAKSKEYAAARAYDAVPRDAPIEQIQAASDAVDAAKKEHEAAAQAYSDANAALAVATAEVSKETLDRLEQERSDTRRAVDEAQEKADETGRVLGDINEKLKTTFVESDPRVKEALARAEEANKKLDEARGTPQASEATSAMYSSRTALEQARAAALNDAQQASPEWKAAAKADDDSFGVYTDAKAAADRARATLDVYQRADQNSKNDATPPMLSVDEFRAQEKVYKARVNAGEDPNGLAAEMGPSYWATYYDQPEHSQELEHDADVRRGAWIHIGGVEQASYRFAAQVAFGLDEGIVWDRRKGGMRDPTDPDIQDRAGMIARWAGQMRLEYRDSQAEINSEDGIERPGTGGDYNESDAKDDYYQSSEYSDAESTYVSEYVDNMSADDKFDLLDSKAQVDARTWMLDNLDEVEKESSGTVPTFTDAWKQTDEAKAVAAGLFGESEYARVAEKYGEDVAAYSVEKAKADGEPGERADVQVAFVDQYLARQYEGQEELRFDESGEPIREKPEPLNGPALSEFRTAVAAEASAKERWREALDDADAEKKVLFGVYPDLAKFSAAEPHEWALLMRDLGSDEAYAEGHANGVIARALGVEINNPRVGGAKDAIESFRQADKAANAALRNAKALSDTRKEAFETLMEPIFEERAQTDDVLTEARDSLIEDFIEEDDAGKKAWASNNEDDWRDKAWEVAQEAWSQDYSAQESSWDDWWAQNKDDYKDDTVGERVKPDEWPIDLHRYVSASTKNYVSNYAESWSLSSSKASGFGSNHMQKSIDPKTVLTYQGGPHWRAKGFGLTEYEFIVLSQYPKWQRQQIMRDMIAQRRKTREKRKGVRGRQAGHDPRAADGQGSRGGLSDAPRWGGGVARWAGASDAGTRRLKGYDPTQPRDEGGRWTDGGGDNHEALRSHDPHEAGGVWADADKHHSRYGVVVMREDKVLLREPTNHYEGFVWTFARGGREHGEHPLDTALREGAEEYGHKLDIVREIPHVFRADRPGSKWASLYYLARSREDTGKTDWETASTRWATYEEAKKLIGLSTNVPGRNRDLKVLDAAFGKGSKETKGAEWNEELHPRGEGGRFTDGGGQISWEASPHPESGILPGINSAPYSQRREYLRAVRDVIAPKGEDSIAEWVGLKGIKPFEAAGLYMGDFNPGVQVEIPSDTPKDKIEAYSAALGYVLSQDAVAYHLPTFKEGDRSKEGGGELRLGRQIKNEEMRALYAALPEAVRNDIALVPSRLGVRALNFSSLDNETFHKTVTKAAEAALDDDASYKSFGFDGDLISNHWKEAPHGESYRQRLGGEGRRDLLRRLDGLAEAIERVNREYSARYGWGEHRRQVHRAAIGLTFKAAGQRKAEAARVDRELLVPWERRFRDTYRKVVREIRAEALSRVGYHRSTGKPFDLDHWAARMKAAMTPLYRRAMIAAARDCALSLLKRRKAEPRFVAKATDVFPGKGEVQRITDPVSLSESVEGAVQTIYDAVKQLLDDAVDEEMTDSDMLGLLESEFADILDERADIVGTTEAAAAIGNARAAVMVSTGLEQNTWETVGDERVRPTHVIFGDAGPKPIGFNWAKLVGMGETLLRWPMDEKCEEPSLVVNCRCMAVPADDFEGTEEELNAILGDLGEAWGAEEDDTISLSADDYLTKGAEWDESEHPRGEAGRFSESDGGGGALSPKEATVARPFVRGWVADSSSKMGVAMKLGIKAAFGAKGSVYDPYKAASRVNDETKAKATEAARILYRSTQDALARAGVGEEIKLYRGLDKARARRNVAESWTTDRAVAARFGKHVIEQTFSRKQVLAFAGGPLWSNQYKGEQEYVVMPHYAGEP